MMYLKSTENDCFRWEFNSGFSNKKQDRYPYGPVFSFSFCQFNDTRHFIANLFVVLPDMGFQTVGAVLDAVFRIGEAAAAFVTKAVQRAVAEQAAESFRIGSGMTGKVFTFPILKKIIICHDLLLYSANSVQGHAAGGSLVNSIFSPVAGWVKRR